MNLGWLRDEDEDLSDFHRGWGGEVDENETGVQLRKTKVFSLACFARLKSTIRQVWNDSHCFLDESLQKIEAEDSFAISIGGWRSVKKLEKQRKAACLLVKLFIDEFRG